MSRRPSAAGGSGSAATLPRVRRNYDTIPAPPSEADTLLQRSSSVGPGVPTWEGTAPTATGTTTSATALMATEALPSIEDVAAALREKLPGRSRKAKGQFRRLQRPKDDWRGRLTVFSEASGYDLTKLAERLKREREPGGVSPTHRPSAGSTGRPPRTLLDPAWFVKVHFDVLHLSFGRRAIRSLMEDTEDSAAEGEGLGNAAPAFHGGGGGGGSTADTFGSMFDLALHRDIFLFSFGSVVFWGFASEREERAVLADLEPYIDGQVLSDGASQNATEEMEFTFGVTSRVQQDVVELATFSSGEKLAASCAIAQSSLLSIHEWRAQQTIARNERLPSQIAETGEVTMSTTDITKEIGRLFVERHLVNLEPELLETPEVIWSDNTYEETYQLVFSYLEIRSRIDLLNRRFAIMGQLLDVLRTQQEQGHANRLEWIIIVLVAAEVALQLVWNILLKDVLGWVGQRDRDGF